MTFEEKLEELENGCIIFTGFVNKGGYGRFRIKGKNILAHRYAFEKYYGELSKDICVLHKCDNRRCCNPTHLFLGSRGDNNMDRAIKNRSACGESNGRSKLTQSDVIYIIMMKGKITQHNLAKMYGVSRSAIQEIMEGRNWRSIHDLV
jgi:hypothetical protein